MNDRHPIMAQVNSSFVSMTKEMTNLIQICNSFSNKVQNTYKKEQ